MNKLDLDYQNLLKDILENGVKKEDRTGTGTISVFGRQIRHKMSDGFPLLTSKKMPFKNIVTELIWFLTGDTNIKYLVDNNCNIWVGDAYKAYKREWMKGNPPFSKEFDNILPEDEFIVKIKTDEQFAKRFGELGPIYGKQWRQWDGYHKSLDNETRYIKNINGIDQIQNLISDLKTTPDSRRLMVNAWAVDQIDKMTLPPCHYGFQVYTRELTLKERNNYYTSHYLGLDEPEKELDRMGIPSRAISLQWNQRSVDTFLGLPFNIASYGLLLIILGKIVNMVPDELIGNLGDTHLYSNHINAANEQIGRVLSCDERIDLASADALFDPFDFGIGLSTTDDHIHRVCDAYEIPRKTREPFELPKIQHMKTDDFYKSLSSDLSLLSHLDNSDFHLIGYQSHSAIKAPLSN